MTDAKFPAFQLQQNGKVFYLTYMNAEQLVDNTESDLFDAKKKSGYQRRINPAHAKEFNKFMSHPESVSPTAIILSYRGTKPIFTPRDGANNYGILTLSKEKLWQVDGQHRIKGLTELVNAARGMPPIPIKENMLFPVIIICPALWGAKDIEDIKFQEAFQFYVINKTHKGVDAALTDEFQAKIKEKLGGLGGVAKEPLPQAMIRNIDWVPNAIDITDELNNSSSVWANKILLANEQPHAGTFVNQKAFTDSLNALLKSDLFRSIPKEGMIKILDNYWMAIREICPEAYTAYTKYVLFRRTGVFVMHSILPDVINLINSYIGPVAKATDKTFKEVLKVIPELNSDQWKTDSEWGNMGTSHKAIKIIADTIRDSLRSNFTKN